MHFLIFWTCRKQWWRGVAWSETTDNLKVTGVKNMSLINLFKKTSPSRSSKSWQIPKRLCTSASVSYLENRLGHTLWRSSLVSLVSRRERCLICIWFSTSPTVIRRFVRIIVWTCSMLSSVVNISENPADLSVQCWTSQYIHTHSTDKNTISILCWKLSAQWISGLSALSSDKKKRCLFFLRAKFQWIGLV